MYYRKKFEGTVETGALVAGNVDLSFVGGSGSVQVNLTLTDILGKAVVDTLNAGGITSSYDEENHIITINGMKAVLYYPNSSSRIWNLYCGGRVVASTGSSSYQPFSSSGVGNYAFYITVKGDPNTGMHVYISTNLTSNTEYKGFNIIRGKDLYNDKDVVFISDIDNECDYYVRNLDGSSYELLQDCNVRFEKISLTQFLLSGDSAKEFVPLWKKRDESGYFMMNAYVMPSNKPNGNFFNFDNKLFCYFDSSTIVECSTQMPAL